MKHLPGHQKTLNGHKILDFQNVDEIEAFLREKWPSGWVTIEQLFEFFRLNSPIDRNVLRSKLGVDVYQHKVADIADFIWDNSNYGKDDDE